MKNLLKKIVIAILTFEAQLALKKYKPRIIAITGSVGKTSTKDAIFTVLNHHFYTRKSEKSFNSEIGLPLSILGLPNAWNNPFGWVQNIIKGFLLLLRLNYERRTTPYPEWLILEIGADRPGDIEKVGTWLSPDIVIITRFGKVPVHVEFFKSREDVIREKCFLVKALKSGGLLLLNNDDEDVRMLRDMRRDTLVTTWGIEQEPDFQASNFEISYEPGNSNEMMPAGMMFKVNHTGNSIPIHISGTLGRQQVYPVLAALATGDALGLNMVSMAGSLKEHKSPVGRMRIIAGVKNTTIIDDSYNSSPVAATAALETLREIRTSGKKIAVLGDMLQLGKHSVKEHIRIGKEAKGCADILVTVGILARDIAKGALENGMDEKNIFQFDTSAEAAKPVEELLASGDTILVKGSQASRTEKIVEEIMSHPEDKD
ncbi:MAG: UDP-N-acetylmuramoyl-tripeptide--D-alanyl-D-alanine ligase, partial [bacterium]|nr:UDP-N-acetylmuramoyl-tripeptide--D-alanyl-D-alanine ligase [bacterium]